MQISAIILAGGKSKRMGTDKAMMKLDGVTLLDKVIALCQKVCDDILISSNKQEHKVYGYPLVADEVPDCGPIGGIYSCLKESKTRWNFVISVDAAYVDAGFVDFLKGEIFDGDAIVPYTQRGKEPLIALYNKSCLKIMEGKIKSGDYKMQHLLNVLNTKFVEARNWEKQHPKLFHNLNAPEDMEC